MSKTKKIVITGPESTGKSTLTKQLAGHYKVPYISEIARNYVENLKRPYEKNDVIEIARLQIDLEKEIINQKQEFIFLDTDLIITKIWLLHVYNDCPTWIDEYIKSHPAYLHLLCYYDIPWKHDPVRENPELRPYFFNKYLSEIQNYGMNYEIVKGQNNERFKNAVNILSGYKIII